MSPISVWSALDSESSPTSSKPDLRMPFSTMSPIVEIERSRTGRVIMPAWQKRQRGGGPGRDPPADRPRDQPGLAEAAAAGAAAEDLDAEPLVHGLGQRHERVARVGPGVEV